MTPLSPDRNRVEHIGRPQRTNTGLRSPPPHDLKSQTFSLQVLGPSCYQLHSFILSRENSLDRRRSGRVEMKSFYGFTKPYNFKRAFPFVTAIVFLFLIIGIMGSAAFVGTLNWGTYRFAYFLYIGSIALTAAALSFAPKLAWSLIALSFIEFSLGMSTSVLTKMHIVTRSILPLDIRLNEPPRFRFHPLLQGTPTPNFLRLLPFRI